MVAGRQPARHRRVPAARAPRRVRPEWRPPAHPRRHPGQRQRSMAGRLDGVRQRRRQPVRRADQVRPQVARVVQPVAVHRDTATRSRRRSTTSSRSSRRWPRTATPRCAWASPPTWPPAGRTPTGWRTSCSATRASTTTTSGSPTRSRSTRPRSSPTCNRSSTCGRATTCTPPAARSRRPGSATRRAQALVDGDCMMVHQANFFAANFANAGAAFGDGRASSTTSTCPSNEGQPTEVGGINAGAFRDAPEVWAVMQFLASADFANARQAAQTQIASTSPATTSWPPAS